MLSREAIVTVKNRGAYVAKFSLSYRYYGDRYAHETEPFFVFQEKSLTVPPYASEVRLKIENMIFIFVWNTMYETDISPWRRLCIRIEGTIFNPYMNYC